MLTHIVLFKLNESTTQEDLAEIKERLEALTDKIPELLSMKVFIDNISDENYDFALESTFKNKADLASYAVHPAHLDVVQLIKPKTVSRACVDSEA